MENQHNDGYNWFGYSKNGLPRSADSTSIDVICRCFEGGAIDII